MSDFQKTLQDEVEKSSTDTPLLDQSEQAGTPSEKDPLQQILHSGFSTFKKLDTPLVALLLVIGVSLSVGVSLQQTNLLQRASGPTPTPKILPIPANLNLNSTSATLPTTNPDGTMGPQSARGNWSNTKQASSKGKLNFVVQGVNATTTIVAMNLVITKVEVHTGGHWETLNTTSPLTLDLVQLSQSKSLAALGITELAAGQYTEVRLYIKTATVKLANGSTAPLRIFGKDNIVRVVKPFTIKANQTTQLAITLDVSQSILEANGRYLLRPFVTQLGEH